MMGDERSFQVVIAEDSPTQREYLRYILEKHGYTVSAGADGREALDLVEQVRPDLVISDVIMPVMNGYDLCRAIKSDPAFQGIPVILLTALSDTRDVALALESGADNFITKPYNEEYLVLRIRQILAPERALMVKDWVKSPVPVSFDGEIYQISSEKGQIFEFLLTAYQVAIMKNQEVIRAEDALRLSEQHYRSLVEQSPDAIFVNRDNRIVYVNPAALQLFGADTPNQVLGKTPFELFHSDYHEVMRDRIHELHGGSPGTLIDEQIVRLDGTVRDVEVAALSFFDEAGQAIEVILRDVTERTRAEQALICSNEELNALNEEITAAQEEMQLNNEELLSTEKMLRESEADARSFMENQIDACAICETIYAANGEPIDIRLVGVNAALTRELGRPAAEIVGRTAFELLPELTLPWFDRFLEVGRTGEATDFEERFPALDRWYRIAAFPVRGRRIAVLFRDITERKQAEKALKESEERYRSVVENSIDAVLLTSPDGSIQSANAGACRIFGMTEEELILAGRDYVMDRSDPRLAAALEERNRTGRFRGELTYRRKDGTTRTGEVATALFKDQNGAVRTTMIIRDITDRKEVEESLRDYTEQLRVSNEELQRFAYVASHDLQEPLRSIVSFSQLIDRRYRGKLDEDADAYLGYIVDGGQRMQALIKDLLRISLIETQAQPLVPTNASAVVADAVRSLEIQIQEVGAVVTVDPLPIVMADPSQLEQLFTNLIGNAIKYRQPEVPAIIRISATPQSNWWEFSIADNGIGIKPEYYNQIFEMFRRLHTKGEYEGTGIGLAIVRKIVERHGGIIWVESTPGQGSTFFFTLPVV